MKNIDFYTMTHMRQCHFGSSMNKNVMQAKIYFTCQKSLDCQPYFFSTSSLANASLSKTTVNDCAGKIKLVVCFRLTYREDMGW
jgi:hypothetical protein